MVFIIITILVAVQCARTVSSWSWNTLIAALYCRSALVICKLLVRCLNVLKLSSQCAWGDDYSENLKIYINATCCYKFSYLICHFQGNHITEKGFELMVSTINQQKAVQRLIHEERIAKVQLQAPAPKGLLCLQIVLKGDLHVWYSISWNQKGSASRFSLHIIKLKIYVHSSK